MKVRIRQTPLEKEVDGVPLDALRPGLVREVSASVGTWLVAQGYALPEMRASDRADDHYSVFNRPRQFRRDVTSQHRRKDDR